MADRVYGMRSVRLHDLLSAPLVALIRADAEAAQATLEYIETLGLVQTADGDQRLRMADFRYQRLDENNEYSEFVASVPLLSLVPIPALQIQDAEIELSAKITDVSEEPQPKVVGRDGVSALKPISRIGALPQATRFQMLAKPAASSAAKDQETREAFHLKIKVTLTQADVPMGMERLFSLMDQAMREEKASDKD